MKNISCREYNAIDILKFVLAILVVIIHSGIDKTFLSPVLRTAVPLFFIISSYFFFSKIKKAGSEKEKNKALFHTVKRNLLLYLFWSVVQLPLIIFMRGYHHDFLPGGARAAVKDILLGSGFTGSWYIVALVIGLITVFLLSKIIPSTWLAILTLPIYILCCLTTNYGNLFDAGSIVYGITNGYHELTGLYIYTGFPVALFWISLGRLLAEKAPKIKTETLSILAALSGILLILELFIILHIKSAFTDDCYIMLAFLCPIIFLLVQKSKHTFKSKIRIRELGVLIYVTHGCVGRIVGYALKLFPTPDIIYEPTKLIITIAASITVGMIVIFIKEHTKLSIFKYIC